jgi:glycosyltransferase involved in cell wall biosynthesis
MTKIAFVSTYDSDNINNWSGSPYYISKTVKEYIGNIDFIGNLRSKFYFSNLVKDIYYSKLKKKVFLTERTKIIGKYYAKQVDYSLKRKNYDLIISIGVIPIAYLETEIPIVMIADANFNSMVNYYIKNLSKQSCKDGNNMELLGFDKSKLIVFASDWATLTAINYYSVDKNKVKTIPFGANINNIPNVSKLKYYLSKPLELLFIGKEWERKGGDIVYETFLLLNKNGIETNLTIVGTIPQKIENSEKIKIIPFINKNIATERLLFESIMFNTDIFFMPSREECYGIVFCESNAYGIPCVASNTGGITTIIKDGINGYTLPISSDAKEYAELISKMIQDENIFLNLRKTSRKRFEEILNWDAFGKSLNHFIKTNI